MVDSPTKGARWWGRYDVPLGAVQRWRIGPLTLRVQRFAREWRLATERSTDYLDGTVAVAEAEAESDLREAPDLLRIGMQGTAGHLHLLPRLADRPVVSRPDAPFRVLGRDEVTLYVSTPLWLAVQTPDASTGLYELPIFRPSDTWFGANTREGDLCYATRTVCRLDLADVPFRPHRAVTAVRIVNRAESPLVLDRVSLPVGNLTLYDADGALWTESLTLTRLPDEDLAPVTLGKGPPAAAPGATRLAGPREEPPANLMIRAFSQLFR